MKFVFNNSGPIARAELELGDFTIISGRNNTGKTRIVYALYGFMKTFTGLVAENAESFCESHFRKVARLSTIDIVDKLRTEGGDLPPMSCTTRNVRPTSSGTGPAGTGTSRTARAVNAGPLSERMWSGAALPPAIAASASLDLLTTCCGVCLLLAISCPLYGPIPTYCPDQYWGQPYSPPIMRRPVGDERRRRHSALSRSLR